MQIILLSASIPPQIPCCDTPPPPTHPYSLATPQQYTDCVCVRVCLLCVCLCVCV